MVQRALLIPALLAAGALTGCGSTGVHTQGNTSPSPSTSGAPVASPTPNTGYGSTQPAVDAYERTEGAVVAALRSPSAATLKAALAGTQGQAYAYTQQTISAAIKAHEHFEGPSPDLQMGVESSNLSGAAPTATVTYCTLGASGFYGVQGGRRVPASPAPKTYAAGSATMVKLNGQWFVGKLGNSSSRMCQS